MPKRPTALTGAAGEHFVAYQLLAMGYTVALTRSGSPTIDLMVGDLRGETTVSIQVKTSNSARREYKRKPEKNCWEWDVGAKALSLRGESIFYAFVDMKWDDQRPVRPDVFIVPANEVANFLGPDWSRYIFWINDSDADRHLERWDLITDRLSARKMGTEK